jgi:hypothetical protein
MTTGRPLRLILLAGLAACSGTKPREGSSAPTAPDLRVLMLSGGGERHKVSPGQPVQVGSGFNTLTGSVVGDCMESSTLTTLGDSAWTGASPAGQPPATATNDVLITYVEDYRHLARDLGVRASAAVRFFALSVSAEAEYANRSDFSRTSSFLVASATLRNETERLGLYRIREDALQQLRTDPRAFFRRCGDRFVAGRIMGASFTAVMEVRDTTEETRNAIRGKIGGGLSISGFGIEASGEKTRALSQALSRHQLYYKVMSVGLPAENPTTVDGFIHTAANLQQKIDASASQRAAALEFVTASYEIADNFPGDFHLPALAEQDRLLDRLAGHHQETSIVLGDLTRAARQPKTPPCVEAERRRLAIAGNLEASNRRIEERAHACLRDPERMCTMQGIPEPAFDEARLWLAECSDLEAQLQAKARVEETARAEEALKRRVAAAEARRNRGRPGGLACSQWQLGSVTVEVPSANPNGSAWDSGTELPDLYVRVEVGSASRRTPYQKDNLNPTFEMTPPIPMKTGQKLSLQSWDYDSNGFWGEERDLAVSDAITVPGQMPASGLRLANARGTFVVHAICVDVEDNEPAPTRFFIGGPRPPRDGSIPYGK